MTDIDRGQVVADAATVYQDFFVPALFGAWAPRVAAAANVSAGQRVLDVACGTGVLARVVGQLVGPSGSVVGIDVNDAMLAVAERADPQLDWRAGTAEAMPFPDADFDAVVSQFGLMFFEDRAAAIGEMRRVLRPGGRLAVAVWDRIDRSPGYAALAELIDRLFGGSAADSLRTPFSMGDREAFLALVREAGFRQPQVTSELGTATFPSIEAWMFTEIRGWTLAGSVDDGAFDRLVTEATADLARFVQPGTTVRFPISALIATASA